MAGIKNWKRNLRDLIDNPWDSDGDSDHPECPHCGSTMDFYGHDDSGDFPLGEGYWECSNCGFSITENDV